MSKSNPELKSEYNTIARLRERVVQGIPLPNDSRFTVHMLVDDMLQVRLRDDPSVWCVVDDNPRGMTEDEAEAVLAMNMAIKLLHEFYGHIKKDLRYYSEKYVDYMVYSEFIGQLVENKDELLGRLTAWNHRIVQGAESAFLIIDTWEPGKDPKSAYRYYLVKE